MAARSHDLVTALAASAFEPAKPVPAGAAVGPERLAARLQTFPGFDLFRPAAWAALAAAGHAHAGPRGLRRDGGAPLLWVVLRGAVQWQIVQLLVHGPGALVGSAAFVAGTPWSAWLLVREGADLFALPALPDGATGQRLARMLGAALVRDQRRLTWVRARLSAMAAA